MSFPAKKLRAARKARGLTQQQAADLTHGAASSRTWAETEKGRSTPLWTAGCAMLAAVGLGVVVVDP